MAPAQPGPGLPGAPAEGQSLAGTWQAAASTGGGEPEPGFSLVAFQCFKEMELTKGVCKRPPRSQTQKGYGKP